MTLSNEDMKNILLGCPIEGMDYTDGLNRFGGQVSIYLRIIKTFIANASDFLSALKLARQNDRDEYTVRVHGLKGACYGISAMSQGDMARALEFASKDGNWNFVDEHMPSLIQAIEDLVSNLQNLVQEIEDDPSLEDLRTLVEIPDKSDLHRLLNAAQSFDVNSIRAAIDNLDKYRYSLYPQLLEQLKESLLTFRYDLIEDKATELLNAHESR